MATNWSLADGAKAILSGDKAATLELGKRFPLTSVAIAKMGDNEGAMAILEALPIHVTMRKVESAMKGDVDEVDEADVDTEADDDVEEEAPKAKSGRRGRPAKASDDDKKAAAKARREARKAKKAAEAAAASDDDDEEDEDVSTEAEDYSGMNAVDLFKLCKKRGIKAEPKKKAADYIKLLKADDARKADFPEDDEEDDWEEEEPMPKPTKAKGKAKKAAPVEEEEEDDDWDI